MLIHIKWKMFIKVLRVLQQREIYIDSLFKIKYSKAMIFLIHEEKWKDFTASKYF